MTDQEEDALAFPEDTPAAYKRRSTDSEVSLIFDFVGTRVRLFWFGSKMRFNHSSFDAGQVPDLRDRSTAGSPAEGCGFNRTAVATTCPVLGAIVE